MPRNMQFSYEKKDFCCTTKKILGLQWESFTFMTTWHLKSTYSWPYIYKPQNVSCRQFRKMKLTLAIHIVLVYSIFSNFFLYRISWEFSCLLIFCFTTWHLVSKIHRFILSLYQLWICCERHLTLTIRIKVSLSF